MLETELKRKLRKLKALEQKIRFSESVSSGQQLIWNRFFDLKHNRQNATYGREELLSMSPQQYREVVADYLACVYWEAFRQETSGRYDPDLLKELGLPYDAGEEELKRCFRQLAKQHHPDMGGDPEQFIHWVNLYHKLRGQ